MAFEIRLHASKPLDITRWGEEVGRRFTHGLLWRASPHVVSVEMAWDSVAELGPTVSALAAELGFRLEIPGLRPAEQDFSGTSPVWREIQDAAEASMRSIMAAGQGTFDPFALMAATSQLDVGQPIDSGQTAGIFDDMAWHVSGKFPRRAGAEQAYVHIGMFYSWLIMHDLDRRLPKRERDLVRSRTHTGSILRDATDGVVAAHFVKPAAVEFVQAYYGGARAAYLDDWSFEFGEAADRYEVPDTWETFDRIASHIDRRYREWSARAGPRE